MRHPKSGCPPELIGFTPSSLTVRMHMLEDVECPDCNGIGETNAASRSQRSRYVGYDDLSPDDYTEQCPKCGGSGTGQYNVEQAVAAERERCAKILKARASHLRTPEGCISAQWHSNDAFMVAGELERQAEAIRQMKDTNDDR